MCYLRYPPDPQMPFMLESGPSDPDLVVKDGNLLFHQQRDGRFPYLYQVPSHPMVDGMIDKQPLKTSWSTFRIRNPLHSSVYSILKTPSLFPLVPTNQCKLLVRRIYQFTNMYTRFIQKKTGLFEMEDGMVIYARPKGHSTAEHDVVIAWCYLG
jgi:hypothetical protein